MAVASSETDTYALGALRGALRAVKRRMTMKPRVFNRHGA